MSGRPAIFLDRDGTLNESVGYVNHPSRFRLFPWTVEAIRAIRDEGYLAVVVTNQSGIGRGLFGEERMHEVHARLESILKEAGTALDGVYHCPHRPEDGCECRKPRPGLLLAAAKELGCDLARSWIVGDNLSDLEAGWGAGTRAALVRTGYGEGSFQFQMPDWPRRPEIVAPDLHRAACAILWGELA